MANIYQPSAPRRISGSRSNKLSVSSENTPKGSYETPPRSPRGNFLRKKPANLTLEIKVEDFDKGKKSDADPSTAPGSFAGERQGSLKKNKGALLHNLLKPLEFYNERKSRSRRGSVDSDTNELNEVFGAITPLSGSPTLSPDVSRKKMLLRSITPEPVRNRKPSGDSLKIRNPFQRSKTPEPGSKSRSNSFSRTKNILTPELRLKNPFARDKKNSLFKPAIPDSPLVDKPLVMRTRTSDPQSVTPVTPGSGFIYGNDSNNSVKTLGSGGYIYKPSARPRGPSIKKNIFFPSSNSGRSTPTGDFFASQKKNPIKRYKDGHRYDHTYRRESDSSVGDRTSSDSLRSSCSSSSSSSSDLSSSSISSSGSRSGSDNESDYDNEPKVSRPRSVSQPNPQKGVKSSDCKPLNDLLMSALRKEGAVPPRGRINSDTTQKSTKNVQGHSSYHGRATRTKPMHAARTSDSWSEDSELDARSLSKKPPIRGSSVSSIDASGKKQYDRRKKNSQDPQTSEVEKLYQVYDSIIQEGQLFRRHSMEPDRRRHGSGSSSLYLRGEDPNQAAILFRDCRGLPSSAPFLENVQRHELESDESKILVKFFKYHTSYDLIPTSAKLVIFDTRLQVKKAFYALVYNGVRAAPLWDSAQQKFVGMLTITDFIRILQSFYNSGNKQMDELEDHRLEMWRALLNDDSRQLISIGPNECLYDAIRSLIHHKIHRLPVIDPQTGNVLYIITHKRILKFLFLYINELPKPSALQKTLRELKIGSYDNIETAKESTLIIEALNKFVQRRISALPIVDEEGKLVDIYAKFDVINLAAEGTYHNLDISLQQANEYRNEWFEGVLKCNLDETLLTVMERIVRAEVHRLVVVDGEDRVIGVISLSDILNELVLKPCDEDGLRRPKRSLSEIAPTFKDSNDNLSRHKQIAGDSTDISTTEDLSSASQNLDEVFDSSTTKESEETEKTQHVDKSPEELSDKQILMGEADVPSDGVELSSHPVANMTGLENGNKDTLDEGEYRLSEKKSTEEITKSPVNDTSSVNDKFVVNDAVNVPSELLQISG